MTDLIELFEEVLECSVDEDTSMDNCDDWDSMNHVNLILEIQDAYSIKIPSTDVEVLLSFSAVKAYLEQKGKL